MLPNFSDPAGRAGTLAPPGSIYFANAMPMPWLTLIWLASGRQPQRSFASLESRNTASESREKGSRVQQLCCFLDCTFGARLQALY